MTEDSRKITEETALLKSQVCPQCIPIIQRKEKENIPLNDFKQSLHVSCFNNYTRVHRLKDVWRELAGIKFDEDKPKLSLIPPRALTAVGEVLTFGATKYTERNWEKGISEDRLLSATLRHIVAHLQGEVYDPETEIEHLAHAICNLMMQVEFMRREKNDLA